MSRRTLPFSMLVFALVAAAPMAGAQSFEARFSITTVGDSTISFASNAPWVKRGLQGIIVDPIRSDALMGRFEILTARSGFVTALIRAEAGEIRPGFVAVLQPPKTPFYRNRTFWGGALLGLVVGGIAGAAF